MLDLVKIEESDPKMQRRGIDIILSVRVDKEALRFWYVEEKVDRIAIKTGNLGLELDNGFGRFSGWFYNTRADFLAYLVVKEDIPQRLLWIPMKAFRRRWYNGDFKKYPFRSHSESNNTKRSVIKLIPMEEFKTRTYEVTKT